MLENMKHFSKQQTLVLFKSLDFFRSLVLDFLNPVTDVSYALATYIRQGGTGGQLNDLFSMVREIKYKL